MPDSTTLYRSNPSACTTSARDYWLRKTTGSESSYWAVRMENDLPMMDGLLFVLTQPLVYVPWIVLLGLLGTIWLKNSDTKIRTGLFWLISYGFACFGLLAVAYTQRQSGCGFNLADCYSEQLPEGFWVVKFLAVLLYVVNGLKVARKWC